MKKFISLFTSLVLICSLCVSVSAEEAGQFTEIYPENISGGVRVFKNFDTNEMYATLDSVEFKENEEIILYVDPETGYSISVTMEDYESNKMVRDTGVSSWSAGYIPDGTASYRARLDMGANYYIEYMTEVTAYPVVMNRTHSVAGQSIAMSIDEYTHGVYRSKATLSAPAYSELQFKVSLVQYGIVIGTKIGYISLEINDLGQIRTKWSY